jgi:hypothetical protein
MSDLTPHEIALRNAVQFIVLQTIDAGLIEKWHALHNGEEPDGAT